MKYSNILVATLPALLSGVCGCHSEKGTDTGAENPNIIFILCDDMGYGDLACYGQKYIETPNIDKLAQEGMLSPKHMQEAPSVLRPELPS